MATGSTDDGSAAATKLAIAVAVHVAVRSVLRARFVVVGLVVLDETLPPGPFRWVRPRTLF